jgi:hypothetical protein
MVILVSSLICVGCIPEFVNPLSEAQSAKIDKRLLGVWITKDEKEKAYIHFEIDKKDPNLFNVEIKDVDKENKKQTMLFSLFITTTNGKTFMNIKENKDGKLSNFYNIMKYEINGSKLKLFTIDEEKLERALENNKITGSSKKSIFYSLKITDTGSRALDLLENDDLFVSILEFRKLK